MKTQHLDAEPGQTGHLQSTCPAVRKENRRKKKMEKQAKGWQFPPPPPDDEEEEEEMDSVNPNENNQRTRGIKNQLQKIQIHREIYSQHWQEDQKWIWPPTHIRHQILIKITHNLWLKLH